MGRIYENITQTVGNTPLVHLKRITDGPDAVILAKVESMNPLGSVKDRVGIAMIEDAQKRGILKEGAVIIAPTSGNTGIALAFAAAVFGYRLIVTMSAGASLERRKILKCFGAECVLVSRFRGTKGVIKRAHELAATIPQALLLDQYTNPVNSLVHFHSTAEEIWNDTDGHVDILVIGVGTGGMLTGIAEGIKRKAPAVKVVAVEPDASAVLSGGAPGCHRIQGLGPGFIPDSMDRSLIDEVVRVKDEDALANVFLLARQEGILAGVSSGAVIWAALQLAKRPENRGKVIVVILSDTGERYLSTAGFLGGWSEWLFRSLFWVANRCFEIKHAVTGYVKSRRKGSQ